MSSHAEQLEMLSAPRVEPMSWDLQVAVARRCRSRKEALRRCWEASGLEPKQVYIPLGIPQPNFTKMMQGQAYMDPDIVPEFMKLCGNIIPIHYDALMENCELVPIKTDLELKLANAEKRIAELEQKLAWTVELAVKGAR